MSFLEILLIAVGLAMDAFAVALTAGTTGHGQRMRPALRISFHFGLFQFLMPVIGWYLGTRLEQHVAGYGRRVAFGLLALVGAHMLYESFQREPDELPGDPTRGLRLVTLCVATSLDALAVGLSLAMIGQRIWYPSAVIGVVTAVLSLLGIHLGNRLRGAFGKRMEQIGAVILIAIGAKLLF
jgi:manganese efflux pump family protein